MRARALYSYRQAQSNLEKLTVRRRSVNNHNNIKLLTTRGCGALENLKTLLLETVPRQLRQ